MFNKNIIQKNKLMILNIKNLVLKINDNYDNDMIKQRENNTFYNKIIGVNNINKK